MNESNSAVMSVTAACYDIFIDIANSIYCSMYNQSQVMMKTLGSSSNMWIVAAGTGCVGSGSNQLNGSRGIHVDQDLNLYVADCGNNRVQKFLTLQIDAITIAGSSAPGTISLNCPSDVVLDGDGYLFIVDRNNHRIVGSSSNGYQCIIGCSGSGSTISQLSFPQSMAFDSYGNLYVTDSSNDRIQKFAIEKNDSGKRF